MKIIIVRHGETKENAAGIIQGQSHGKLSKNGIEQVKRVGERLKDEKIDYIYTSDLKRAVDTAKEIHKYHKEIPLIKRKEIREMDYGKLQDKQKDEINYYYHKENDPDYFKKNNVESLESVYNRIKKFLEEIMEKHKDKNVVIVSHAMTLKIIFLFLNKKQLSKINEVPKNKNTSISVFENGKFTKIDCTKHLE